MKKTNIAFSILMAAIIVMAACSKENQAGESSGSLNILEPVLPGQSYQYSATSTPAHIPGDFLSSSINNEVATLGRVLFYDKLLSINNSIACASCHLQQFAFSDGQKNSLGVTAAKTSRNSLAIMNASREGGFFWDLRENSLNTMVLKPFQNHVEMGFDKMDNVVANIQKTPYYAELFTKAFGSGEVTSEKIADALTQFLASMKSHNSKYDIGKQTGFSNFNTLELIGMELFTRQLYCKGCHLEPDFNSTWGGAANIGLDLDYEDEGTGALNPDPDKGGGAFEVTGLDGAFKIPSLRNIELTAPYMHDGRFKTLEQVIEHYNSGVQDHPNLDWNLRTLTDKTGRIEFTQGPAKLNLTQTEKDALVAFLKTLTDYSYVNDVRFSNPFRVKNNN
jgi:cytochrome c peroxidase